MRTVNLTNLKRALKDFLQGNDYLCEKCNTYVHRDNYDMIFKICDNCGINALLLKRLHEAGEKINQQKIAKDKEQPKVIDRGVDEILVLNGKEIRIDRLTGKQVVEVLNEIKLTDVKMISFDEYEKEKEQKAEK